jgi:SAM-dependent methyltransferase
MSAPPEATCRVCQAKGYLLGQKRGNLVRGPFDLYRCPACGYVFVGEPCTDYALLYSSEYYEGRGADPLIDYTFELEHPELTIRKYEWSGILEVVRTLRGATEGCRWLDYGCGNGALVRHVRARNAADIVGFDEGAMASRARALGIPVLDEAALEREKGAFDVITAVEVFEHMVDPAHGLRRIRSLLKPGGLLFYTTGNAEPFHAKVLEWPYVIPDIHVGVFEPRTLCCLLRQNGFRVEQRGLVKGWEDILRFKILKNLNVRRVGPWEAALPWPALVRIADARYQVTAHPTAWAD